MKQSEQPNRSATRGGPGDRTRQDTGGRRPQRRTKTPARPQRRTKPPAKTERQEPFRPGQAVKWTAVCFLLALLILSLGAVLQAHAAKNVKWENPYVDVTQNMWSYQYITELNRLGVFPDDQNFEPTLSESRGGLALSLYRMDDTVFAEQKAQRIKDRKANKTPDPVPPAFSDVDAESELYEAVCWTYDAGIMKGVSDTLFDPGTELTREQVCTIMARFAAYEEIPLIQVVQPNQFDDSLDIDDYARSGVTACQMAAVVKGDGEGNFNPLNPMSRQEVAAVLYRVMTAAQAPLMEGVTLVDLSPGAYDALYETYTRPLVYTQALIPAGEEVTMLYWGKTVFIGDSVSVMLESYQNSTQSLPGAKFLCAGSMSATNILNGMILPEWPKGSGTHPPIQDSVSQTGAEVVYIMLGMNNIAMGVDRAISDMVSVATSIQEANPEAAIIFQSVTPMTEDSPRKDGKLNNDTINAYNQQLETVAQEHQWYFLNVAEVFKDENGNLIPSYCSDPKAMGMHFTYAGTAVWVDYLKTHVPAELLQRLGLT